jgi:acyl-CoA thioester hydrolase
MTTERIHIYTHQVPIRWRDVDPFNVVNHSAYFTYMEEARWEWFYSLKIKQDLKFVTPIVNANISFKKPLFYPGNVIIKIYTEQSTEKSWTIYHEMYSELDKELLCAEASVKFVSYDPIGKCVIAIPEVFRMHLYSVLTALPAHEGPATEQRLATVTNRIKKIAGK